MKIKRQEKVWDDIAPEWHEYKQKPSENAVEFLKKSYGNVLDLGSGSGRHLTKIKKGKMFLLDFSKEMLELAKEKSIKEKIPAEFIKSELDKIPEPDEFFDFAIYVSALHCVETSKKRKKSVDELYRVLKKGAKAYIGVWNKNSKRFNKKENKERLIGWTNKGERYYYLFDEGEVHELFRSVGFKIILTQNSEMMINFIVEK